MKHLDLILEKCKAEGKELTPDELGKLSNMQNEIDRLYNQIVSNQELMSIPLITIPQKK